MWLSRTLLHLIMSGLADAGGKSGQGSAVEFSQGSVLLRGMRVPEVIMGVCCGLGRRRVGGRGSGVDRHTTVIALKARPPARYLVSRVPVFLVLPESGRDGGRRGRDLLEGEGGFGGNSRAANELLQGVVKAV